MWPRAANGGRDVAKLRALLTAADNLDLAAGDGPTGQRDLRFNAAVAGFYGRNDLRVDGLVKPDGPTIQR
jgi:hypothetical protein